VPDVLRTERLVLVPVSPADADAVLAGDGSRVRAAAGWPPEDTVELLRTAREYGGALGWFVMLGDLVVGDCGTHGPPDDTGDLEIRYAITAPYRRRGFATEVIAALVEWGRRDPAVRRVVGRRIRTDNLGSRRALERCGFALDEVGTRHVSYALSVGE
jgi:RimJ/RimL family protein N-acetyltransferase